MPSILQQPPARPELVSPARLMPSPSTAPPMLAMAARDPGKRYGHVQALRSLTCQALAGQICGFLGHNGAGKTPALKFRTTAPRADSGSARMLGWEVRRDAERMAQHIGVVDEEQNLYERISARDNLALLAGPYAVPDAPRRSGEVLALVGLGSRARDPADKYSNLSGVSLLAGFPILLALMPFFNVKRALLGSVVHALPCDYFADLLRSAIGRTPDLAPFALTVGICLVGTAAAGAMSVWALRRQQI